MLNKLSFRNAKRQFKEYILYFVTLACTVSIMYAFNTLIFSDVVKELSTIYDYSCFFINCYYYGVDY